MESNHSNPIGSRSRRKYHQEEKDPEVRQWANEEIQELQQRLEALSENIKLELLPKDETEHADAVIEIRAGAGGDEAGLFASEVFRMYQRYAENRKWKLKY
ncbi:MAG: hypothetical protein CM1200mP39_14360 [Dehalococcoidia bacterium]|nr:MAG: hypothetical protein CM1200mP39_14360 [Dehalococcoidia bacterium]